MHRSVRLVLQGSAVRRSLAAKRDTRASTRRSQRNVFMVKCRRYRTTDWLWCNQSVQRAGQDQQHTVVGRAWLLSNDWCNSAGSSEQSSTYGCNPSRPSLQWLVATRTSLSFESCFGMRAL